MYIILSRYGKRDLKLS